jgi:BirA family biotin operon repressor/biotin-[acetyl-CoA-carboxylase] ligase
MSLDTTILAALRAAGGGYVSGNDLAERLHVSRAAIWARVEELRHLGYEIEATPHQGYRLINTPDVLLADDLLARLGRTRVIGRDIRVFQQTTSTNDVVEKLARDGVKEGVVVFAEAQTRGRGRLGRTWLSPARKGLWFSVLLRPPLRPGAITQVTIAAATALVRAIRRHTGLVAEIKWPNDVLVQGRKVAGVLTELSAELDRVHHVVLGIGVDVNVAAGEFPAELRRTATSLQIETKQPVDRAALAVEVLRALDDDYQRLRRGEFGAVAAEWERACSTLGRDVLIRVGDREVRGRAESLDPDGALLVRTEHGYLERIIGGDVTLAGPTSQRP